MPITLLAIDIVNQALTGLGNSPIANLDDSNDRALTCNLHYFTLKEKLLSEFPWSFAKKRVQLAALTSDPVGWDFEYQIPSDASKNIPLKVYQNSDTNSPPFKDYYILNDRLYTNVTEIWVEYPFIPDESTWPAYFADLVVYALMERIEEAVSAEKEPKRDLRRTVYGPDLSIPGGMLSAARRTDRRDAPVVAFEDYDVLNARSAGFGGHIV